MTEALRPPQTVMRLSRLGSLHQSRLSFMRQLTRRLARENWQITRPIFEIDANGEGHAVYEAKGPKRSYSLVAFAHDLPADQRSDRVIAERWDATFALYDGVPSAADIERLRQNVPKQEAGRVSETELSLSRANRSVRLWDYVVGELAQGRQPDPAEIEKVGYLMRTTAVYGSGKFGAADRETYSDRDEMRAPFQAEMLSVYLTRTFVRDLINHMAQIQGGADAVPLDEKIARGLGIGNSTGLGMAPFLVNHPKLLNNWILARETAIAQVRDIQNASPKEIARFLELFSRGAAMLDHWHSEHPLQVEKLEHLREDVAAMKAEFTEAFFDAPKPWDRAMIWAEMHVSEEGQEWLASLILEPYGEAVDALCAQMSDDSSNPPLDGAMRVGDLRARIEAHYGWALELDWQSADERARVWYISEEKLEPRLGERFEEDGIECFEQPLGIAEEVSRTYQALATWDEADLIADFVAKTPQFRRIIRRIQITQDAPYAEIHDNTISARLMPIDMLRAKLSFFGATAFDPRSDRWVRITMYQNAPYPEALTADNADDWIYGEGAP